MKALITILIPLLPFIVCSQTLTDSVIIQGTSIRYAVNYTSATYNSGDSISFRSTSTKRRGLVSPLALPVSTATLAALDGKQAILVSGNNIKTINGNSLVGSGDIPISGSPTFINLTSNFSSTSTTPAIVTGWSFAVTTGKTYRITIIADYQTAATTTGGIIGISLTTATGTVRGSARGTVSAAAAATELVIPIRATSGAGSTLTTTGVSAINTPHAIGMDITFTCTGTGTFNIVWATEIAASASQLNANSSLIYQSLN